MVNKIVLSERDRESEESKPIGQDQLDSLEILKRKYFEEKEKEKEKREKIYGVKIDEN